MQKRLKMSSIWGILVVFVLMLTGAVAFRQFAYQTASIKAMHSLAKPERNGVPLKVQLTQQQSVQTTQMLASVTTAPIQTQTLALTTNSSTNIANTPNSSGKIIIINLSKQWMYMYQDGKQLANTAITSGRPGLDTPAGTFHILLKQSPTIFRSIWPKGSPNYFEPTHVNFAMEFIGSGYFIHDAPWRNVYGPGSNDPHYGASYGVESGSHGCVNVPYQTMVWLYNWANIGTTVQITY